MKKLFLLSLIAFASICFTTTLKSQTISPLFFGVNAWMPDTIGDPNACLSPPCIKNGKLYKQFAKIQQSGATIVRYGGIAPDKNKPTMFQYLRMIDSIRAKGMEPMIQVPFWNNRYTAAQAAAIVSYVNIAHAKHVKYWIIGNEPDLSYSYTTAAQIAAYIKPFASAMKNVDPTILIVGPEVASFKKTILDGLTTPGGAYDITGTDAAGRYYVDVISFHTYPLQAGTTYTRAQAIVKLTSTGSYQDNLTYLNTRIASCNSFHSRTGAAALKTAVTEANVDYANSSTDNLYGIGANSFFGGQFVAELYGIGLKKGVDFINLWSVIEGGSTVTNNCGYLDGSTAAKKPLYYHFQMMAQNFSGTSINCTTNQVNVKSFGSQNAGETTVMLMNEDQSINYNYTVGLSTAAVSGTNPLKINANAGIAMEYSDVIPNQSSLILTFNSTGALIKKTFYSLSGNAVAGLPPTVTLFGPVCSIPSGLNSTLVTANTATLNWSTTGAASYNVRYKTLPSASWTTLSSTTLSKAISGLTPSTAYEFQVQGVCSATASSAYSASQTFTTTAPPCIVPAGLNATLITPVSATLNWTATGAASYNVMYKATSASLWINATATAASLAISGLMPLTSYDFKVQSVCSATSSSAFSAASTFTTPALPVSTTLVISAGLPSTASRPGTDSVLSEHSQLIITNPELRAAGFDPEINLISSLSFFINASGQTADNFTIKIRHVSSSVFVSDSFLSTSGAVTVYSAGFTPAASAWNKCIFTEPFVYNGKDNLLIDISWDHVFVPVIFQAKAGVAPVYKTLYHPADAQNASTGILSYERPDMILEFAPAVNVATGTETIRAQGQELNLYPNPASSDLTISFNSTTGTVAKISIYTASGVLVKEIRYLAGTSGNQVIPIDLATDIFTDGTYICSIDLNGKRISKKFILKR